MKTTTASARQARGRAVRVEGDFGTWHFQSLSKGVLSLKDKASISQGRWAHNEGGCSLCPGLCVRISKVGDA
jgi:hypothetical protein